MSGTQASQVGQIHKHTPVSLGRPTAAPMGHSDLSLGRACEMPLSSCGETGIKLWVEERVVFRVSLTLAKGSLRASIGEGHEAFLIRERQLLA